MIRLADGTTVTRDEWLRRRREISEQNARLSEEWLAEQRQREPAAMSPAIPRSARPYLSEIQGGLGTPMGDILSQMRDGMVPTRDRHGEDRVFTYTFRRRQPVDLGVPPAWRPERAGAVHGGRAGLIRGRSRHRWRTVPLARSTPRPRCICSRRSAPWASGRRRTVFRITLHASQGESRRPISFSRGESPREKSLRLQPRSPQDSHAVGTDAPATLLLSRANQTGDYVRFRCRLRASSRHPGCA